MRDIKVAQDRGWLVIQTTRYRKGKPPLVKRTYWSPEEFERIVDLVRLELSPSTSAGEPS